MKMYISDIFGWPITGDSDLRVGYNRDAGKKKTKMPQNTHIINVCCVCHISINKYDGERVWNASSWSNADT